MNFNSVVDDLLILIVGALLGKEVLSNVKSRTSGTSKDSETP